MEVLIGSRENRIKRLQEEWDRYIKFLKEDVEKNKITNEQAYKLADAYHQGLWEGVRAVYGRTPDRPQFDRIGDEDFFKAFAYIPD